MEQIEEQVEEYVVEQVEEKPGECVEDESTWKAEYQTMGVRKNLLRGNFFSRGLNCWHVDY